MVNCLCSYVIMKALETSAKRYDRGIKLITWGNNRKIKEKITSWVSENDRILEIGIGTGTLAILCAERGAHVTGFDISSKMLEIAKLKIKEKG